MESCSGSSTLSTYAVMSVTSTAYSSSHSCFAVPREGGAVVYPWSPGRRAGRARGTPGGSLAGFVGGVVAPQGVGRVWPGCPLSGGGVAGGH